MYLYDVCLTKQKYIIAMLYIKYILHLKLPLNVYKFEVLSFCTYTVQQIDIHNLQLNVLSFRKYVHTHTHKEYSENNISITGGGILEVTQITIYHQIMFKVMLKTI